MSQVIVGVVGAVVKVVGGLNISDTLVRGRTGVSRVF